MRISELPSLWQTRSSNSAPSRFSSASFKVVNPSEVWFLWFITTKVVSVSYIVCVPFWVGVISFSKQLGFHNLGILLLSLLLHCKSLCLSNVASREIPLQLHPPWSWIFRVLKLSTVLAQSLVPYRILAEILVVQSLDWSFLVGG